MIEKDKLVIPFEINWHENKVEAKAFLTIRYGTYNDDVGEKELELSDGEDLNQYIQSISSQKYDEIFEEYEMTDGIAYVDFVGINVSGRNEKGSMVYHLKDNHKHARITVSSSVTKDANQEKMEKILAIIKE